MTREEAIGQLTRLRSYCLAEAGTYDRDAAAIWKADAEALSIAIAALRGRYGIDVAPEIITNADCIRKMSEKELAVFLSDFNMI